MESALQLQLQDLKGLPFIAGIIWFGLLGICLLAIAIVLIRKKLKPEESRNQNNSPRNKNKPKGF
jgi:hypothetical protein